jgi:hypothetical protein
VADDASILKIGDYIQLPLAETHPEISQYSYPLLSVDNRDGPDLYASCVLLECDSRPYIVTAAHAIAEICDTGSSVHVGARHIVALPPEFVLSSPRGNDPLDIGAMPAPAYLLDREAMKALPERRTTAGHSFPAYHLRCVHGYPCNKNKRRDRLDLQNKHFTRYGFSYAGASRSIRVNYSAFRKDSQLHVALQYQRKGRDHTGRIVMPPHPRGISGGGLWLVPDIASPAATYLEGIAIEYHKSRALVFATRIEHVLAFIREHVRDSTRQSTANSTAESDACKSGARSSP